MKPLSTEAAVPLAAVVPATVEVRPLDLPPLVPPQRTPAPAATPTSSPPAAVQAARPSVADPVPAPKPQTARAQDDSRGAEVRRAHFDRPLSGPRASGGLTAGWGDPQIDQLIARAAEQARADGLAQGYAAGWAQGRRAAAEREQAERAERELAAQVERRAAAEQARTLLEQLEQASRGATVAAEPAWSELADALTDAALQIARATLARELSAVDAPVAEAVRTALRTLGDVEEASQVVVRVHPGDAAVLGSLDDSPVPDGVRLVPDAGVTPGTVLVTTPVQRLLVDLPGALSRAQAVLQA